MDCIRVLLLSLLCFHVSAMPEQLPEQIPESPTNFSWTQYDINKDTADHLSSDSNPSNFIEYNGQLYFTATSLAHGNELWVYDSNTQKAELAVDALPGAASSTPSELVVVAGKLYFLAKQKSQLWHYDGEKKQASLVYAVKQEGDSNEFASIVSMVTENTSLYLSVSGGRHSKARLLVAINNDNVEVLADIGDEEHSWSAPTTLTYYHNKLFFSSSHGPDHDSSGAARLFSYDLLTKQLTLIRSGFGSEPWIKILSMIDEKLYFEQGYIENRDSDEWLVEYDTNLGAASVIQNSDNLVNCTDYNFELYCYRHIASYGAGGGYDKSTISVLNNESKSVIDLVEFNSPTGRGSFTADQDALYIDFRNEAGQQEYWRYIPGNNQFTQYEKLFWFYNAKTNLLTLQPDEEVDYWSRKVTPFNYKDFLFFAGYDDFSDAKSNGNELRRYDPQTEQVSLVADIGKATYGSAPYDFMGQQDKLFFSSGGSGNKRYVFDKNNDSVMLADDVYPKEISYPYISVGNKMFYVADDGVHGSELWVYDAMTNSEKLVADINPGNEGAAISSFVVFNNILYFIADDGTHGKQLWQHQYQLASTQAERVSSFSTDDVLSNVYEYLGALYLISTPNGLPAKVFRYDPVINNIVPVEALNTITHLINVYVKPTVYNGEMYFKPFDNSTSTLLSFNGKTDRVTTFSIGIQGIDRFYIKEDKLYFFDGDNNLWMLEKNVENNSFSLNKILESVFFWGSPFLFKGDFYWMRNDPHAFELLQLDITTGLSTVIWYSSTYYQYTPEVIEYDNKLFFAAGDFNLAGRELWSMSNNTKPWLDIVDSWQFDEVIDALIAPRSVINYDNDQLTYLWQQQSGITVEIADNAKQQLTFVTPEVEQNEELTFLLTVTDGFFTIEKPITVTVRQVNKAPVIALAAQANVNEGKLYTIVAQASDADGDELTYVWSQLSGSVDINTDSTNERLDFHAPLVTANEQYRFALEVSDGQAVVHKEITINVLNNVEPDNNKSSGGGAFNLLLLYILLIPTALQRYCKANSY